MEECVSVKVPTGRGKGEESGVCRVVEGAGDAAVPAVTGWFLLQATLQSLFRLMAAVQSRQSPSSSEYHLHEHSKDQIMSLACHSKCYRFFAYCKRTEKIMKVRSKGKN